MTGTGDAWPDSDPEFRPGDNLFGGSFVGLDVDSGKVKWYFQYIPSVRYDNDSVVAANLDGQAGPPGRVNFNRAGFWYNLISTPARRAG
jgi:alcohol dehydrogenase (cytochrome c)